MGRMKWQREESLRTPLLHLSWVTSVDLSY